MQKQNCLQLFLFLYSMNMFVDGNFDVEQGKVCIIVRCCYRTAGFGWFQIIDNYWYDLLYPPIFASTYRA